METEMSTGLFSALVVQLPWLKRALSHRNSVFALHQSREVCRHTVGQGVERLLLSSGSSEQKASHSYKGSYSSRPWGTGECGSNNQLEPLPLSCVVPPSPVTAFIQGGRNKKLQFSQLPWYKIQFPVVTVAVFILSWSCVHGFAVCEGENSIVFIPMF